MDKYSTKTNDFPDSEMRESTPCNSEI